MKYFILTVFILMAVILISQVFITNSTAQTETVEYEIIAQFDGFEIRKYPELTVASTPLNSDSYGANSRAGFKKIASYIFGGNSSNSQIAMTSPVQMKINDHSSMSFYMPSEMSLEDLPLPNRKDVNIKTEPTKIVAAIEFSGWASDSILVEKFRELKNKLIEEKIEFENYYSYLGYNPPYQLINRKNEVIINLINY